VDEKPGCVFFSFLFMDTDSGVDVRSEVPERSRKNGEMTFLMISRKFLAYFTAKY